MAKSRDRKNPFKGHPLKPEEQAAIFAELTADLIVRQALTGATAGERMLVAALIPDLLKSLRAGKVPKSN